MLFLEVRLDLRDWYLIIISSYDGSATRLSKFIELLFKAVWKVWYFMIVVLGGFIIITLFHLHPKKPRHILLARLLLLFLFSFVLLCETLELLIEVIHINHDHVLVRVYVLMDYFLNVTFWLLNN